MLVFGDTRVGDESSPDRQEVGVRRVVNHPEYVFLEKNVLSLIQLENPVDITDYVRPVCLSDVENESEVYSNCWIAGWGDVNANSENYFDKSSLFDDNYT